MCQGNLNVKVPLFLKGQSLKVTIGGNCSCRLENSERTLYQDQNRPHNCVVSGVAYTELFVRKSRKTLEKRMP